MQVCGSLGCLDAPIHGQTSVWVWRVRGENGMRDSRTGYMDRLINRVANCLNALFGHVGHHVTTFVNKGSGLFLSQIPSKRQLQGVGYISNGKEHIKKHVSINFNIHSNPKSQPNVIQSLVLSLSIALQ